MPVSAEGCAEHRQTCHCIRLRVRHCLFINHAVLTICRCSCYMRTLSLCLVPTPYCRSNNRIPCSCRFCSCVCPRFQICFSSPLRLLGLCSRFQVRFASWVCVQHFRYALPLSFRLLGLFQRFQVRFASLLQAVVLSTRS
jgi:hypothetical protein